MEQSYYNLPIRHISNVTNEALQYITSRKEHKVTSLATRWKKLNSCCMGGIEPNTVYTIAGISGSGNIILIICNQSYIILRYNIYN